MNQTIFPDVEKLLVARLTSAFEAFPSLPIAENVAVSVKKPAADVKPYPSKIVTVRSDGGSDNEPGVIRRDRVGVNVYAETYAEASELAALVDSILRASIWGEIKWVEVSLSFTRVDNEGPQEQRFASFVIVTKATNF